MRCHLTHTPFRCFLSCFVSYVLLILICAPFGFSSIGKRATKARTRISPVSWPSPQTRGEHRSGELLVRFRAGTSEQDKSVVLLSQGAQRKKQLRGDSGIEKLEVAAGQDPETAAQVMRLNPLVEFAEPNFLIAHDQLKADLGTNVAGRFARDGVRFDLLGRPMSDPSQTSPTTPQPLNQQWATSSGADSNLKGASKFLNPQNELVPNDSRFAEQWALRNTGQSGGQFGADINVTAAWQTTTGSLSTVIAVIDSGIDFTHPDLANNEWTNVNPGPTGDAHGWDYITDTGLIKDEQGHGTAIAGIIAAQGNNAIGVSGVMWRASLMSLRVLDNTGTGDVADAVEAIDYAASHGAQVINLSWGTTGESVALKDAIDRALRRGIAVVCSAGNDGLDVDSTPYYPASYNLNNLIAVASTDNADQLASWSNYGGKHVSIAAPGVNILTTQMGGGYWLVSGTSASAPLVSGIAGLLKSAYPGANSGNVAKAIQDGARPVSSLKQKVSSGGVANAAAALNSLHALPVPSSSPGGNGNGNGSGNGSALTPPAPPGFGSGNIGPGGTFSRTPPRTTTGAPGPNLPNLDDLRQGKGPSQPKASAPIHSNVLCADCDSQNGGGGGSYYPSGDPNFSTARKRPRNETGEAGVDLGSSNFNWSLEILGLPGRAGLDLNLALFANSLVWTKDGVDIKYNADHGWPAPGFRLGFPMLQQLFYDSQTGLWSYEMVTSSGGRIELRPSPTTNIYESTDSTYTQLDVTTPSAPVVRTSDGTQLTFTASVNNEYRCTQIKDRNGNYISATYDANGHPVTITDTLGRIINFHYDGNSNLDKIWQYWNGVEHDWATFYYGTVHVQPNFDGSLLVNGPSNNDVTVLTQVTLNKGDYYTFGYNAAFGQVNKVSHYNWFGWYLAYTSYNMDSTAGQTDCPRFTEQHDWAQSWNGDTDMIPASNEEALTYYGVDPNSAGGNPPAWSKLTTPDGTVYKEFFATTGYQTGLTTSTKTYANATDEQSDTDQTPTWKKKTVTSWTQDDINLSYQKNPRPSETNIYDSSGNHSRVVLGYYTYTRPSGTSCSLLADTYEYKADGLSSYRHTHLGWELDTDYLTRGFTGLLHSVDVYDSSSGSDVLTSRSSLWYDYSFLRVATNSPNDTVVQHDSAYDINFQWRGNVAFTIRNDVNDLNNANNTAAQTGITYNTAGAVVAVSQQHSASLWYQSSLSYADAFSDGNNGRGTFAYPTTVADAEGNQTLTQYNFDFGAVTRVTTPSPNAGQSAPYATYLYDTSGRIQKVTNSVNGAYTRFWYPGNELALVQYTTIQSTSVEAFSSISFDGAGRVRGTSSDHPVSTGGYRGQYTIYDNMGRVSQQSNPTEINTYWTPTGDDSVWNYTTQAYDWKGRPTVTTNPDGSTRENTYGGCGCAGGEVVTGRDEAGRRTRTTQDWLGRLSKVEELNWDQSVYSTTNDAYNVRDQITSITQAGDRVRSFEYDGSGRLWHKTTPEQGTTTYTYNLDDTANVVTDARGATTTFGYNPRHLVTSLTYGVPAGVAATPNVSFGYNAAGNRASMTDGLGSVSYGYDQLSRLTSETRTFTGVGGSFALNYQYNVAGELTNVTNPWSVQVGYNYDKVGQVTGVTGSGYYGVTSYINSLSYRAFGAAKQINYANGKTLLLQYNNRLWLSRWDLSGILGYDYNYNRYGEGNTGRPDYAHNLYDSTLDRAWTYDHVGRLILAYTGTEANAIWGNPTGPYAQGYNYDVWGNITSRVGWGGANASYTATFTSSNQRSGSTYDAAGNIASDGGQSFTYDATGQQATASFNGLQFSYAGDGWREKKIENGVTTYYLRSTALGGQVVCELNASGGWTRGYVYLSGQMLAIQQSGVTWVHQEPLTKGQRLTDSNGNVTSTVELDPWGGNTNRSVNNSQQPHPFTTYERDANESDDAMNRHYNRWWSRFDQPDPYDGSYNATDPQSFNRYSYVQNDPVNFGDPTGLYAGCVHKAMTNFLAKLAGKTDQQAAQLAHFASGENGGADSFKYAAAPNPVNIVKGFFRRGPSARIHFASATTLAKGWASFDGYLASGDYQSAAFVVHSIEDVDGAHLGYGLPFGHAGNTLKHKLFGGFDVDHIIGDEKFLTAANEVLQLLSGDPTAFLTPEQVKDLNNAILKECGASKIKVVDPAPTGGGGGDGGGGGGGDGGGGGLCYYWVNWHSDDGGQTWFVTGMSLAFCLNTK
jgi:RHS repeat-associated protein